ncbi:MAG: hypothetical protein GXO49_05245 [Chlorobi bacterium]|nr:hypothetical protein [Chlorobiota bacterium]
MIAVDRAVKKSLTVDLFVSLLVSFLIVMFFSDAVSKYLAVKGSGFYRVSLLVRLVFEGVMLIYLIAKINRSIITYLELMIILFVFFVIGQVTVGNLSSSLIEGFITFNKYIFLFIVYLFLRKVLTLNRNKKEIIFKILTFLFFSNVLAIVLGFLFHINFFESYFNQPWRYGYNGVFLAANEATYVLVSMLAFFYFRAFYEGKNKLVFYLFALTSLVSGMKAVYIFVFMLVAFHFFNKMKFRAVMLWLIIVVLASGYVIRFIQGDVFQRLIALFINIYEEKGLWYMLLSGRNEILLNETVLVIKDWSFLNLLIGGVDVERYIIEMDLVDLVLFFGILGSAIYIYMFYKSFISLLLWHKFFTFFLFSILFLAFLGGHFLKSPTSAVYFTLVILYFQDYRLTQKQVLNC